MRKVDPRDRLTSAHQQLTDMNWELVENYNDALFLYRLAEKILANYTKKEIPEPNLELSAQLRAKESYTRPDQEIPTPTKLLGPIKVVEAIEAQNLSLSAKCNRPDCKSCNPSSLKRSVDSDNQPPNKKLKESVPEDRRPRYPFKDINSIPEDIKTLPTQKPKVAQSVDRSTADKPIVATPTNTATKTATATQRMPAKSSAHKSTSGAVQPKPKPPSGDKDTNAVPNPEISRSSRVSFEKQVETMLSAATPQEGDEESSSELSELE